MKVLVVGGAGFVGSHVVDLLIDNNIEVVVIDNLSSGKIENINKKAKFYNKDIRSENLNKIFSLEQPNYVVHLAGQVSVVSSIYNPIEDASINILGSINILESCRKNGVSKVIYSSSAAVFGQPEYIPIDENHPLNMISPYGISKHTVEHYLEVYKSLYNLDYSILRYSNVYGPRQSKSEDSGVVSIFINKIINNINPVIYGNGEQTRDFIYVKDVAKANLKAVFSNADGIFNVSTNKMISINSLVKIINNIVGKHISPEYREERIGDIKENYMSYEKINKIMGWYPEYSLEKGIEETITSAKSSF